MVVWPTNIPYKWFIKFGH